MFTSRKPYIVEGLYKWMIDNQLSPTIRINIETLNKLDGSIPKELEIIDGHITLPVDVYTIGIDFDFTVDFFCYNINAKYINKHHGGNYTEDLFRCKIPIESITNLFDPETKIGANFKINMPDDTEILTNATKTKVKNISDSIIKNLKIVK